MDEEGREERERERRGGLHSSSGSMEKRGELEAKDEVL